MVWKNLAASTALAMIERGWVSDAWVRKGIRRLIADRRTQLMAGGPAAALRRSEAFLEAAAQERELALETDKANEQHYEVPAAFFERVLGPHRKYSCCFFREGVEDLATAEHDALKITCERAELGDADSILELGCGWGSLTLWMAAKYPNAQITAVSNSHSQRDHILKTARERGIDAKLNVITCDINEFKPSDRYDRVVSVEMFEHVRNHRQLLERIASWLNPHGKLFVHIFCHREFAYPFETEGAANWMGRHFFSGGMMPSRDLFDRHADHLRVADSWDWNGRHYEKTSNLWARRMDENRQEILQLFSEVYGSGQAIRWFQRWKVFFLACAELFGAHGGNEWLVTHYLLEPAPVSAASKVAVGTSSNG